MLFDKRTKDKSSLMNLLIPSGLTFNKFSVTRKVLIYKKRVLKKSAPSAENYNDIF